MFCTIIGLLLCAITIICGPTFIAAIIGSGMGTFGIMGGRHYKGEINFTGANNYVSLDPMLDF
jgi:hypothetical protein